MPVKKTKLGKNKVRVETPGGVKSKGTTPAKAAKQERLLNAVEHSDWRPTGKPNAAQGIKKDTARLKAAGKAAEVKK